MTKSRYNRRARNTAKRVAARKKISVKKDDDTKTANILGFLTIDDAREAYERALSADGHRRPEDLGESAG